MLRRGNRLLAAACILFLLEAAAHTLGAMSPLPDDPRVRSVVAAMRGLRTPMGLGMSPSLWDISRGLTFTMSVALAAFGGLGLALLAAAPGDRRVVRVTAWSLLAANTVLLGLWWHYRIPPPLLFQAGLTLPLLLAVLLPDPR